MAFQVIVKSNKLLVKLDEMPDSVRDAVVLVTNVLASDVRDAAQERAETRLDVITGKYRDSIKERVTVNDKGVTARVWSHTPYSQILEWGGTIPAHEILPNVAQALKFMGNAGEVFAAAVHHPAVTLKGHEIIWGAFDDMKPEIREREIGAIEGSIDGVNAVSEG